MPTKSSRLALVCLLAVAVLAGACAFPGAGLRRPASEEELRAYQEAVALLPKSRKAAAAKFETFKETWPDSPLVDDAALQLAEIARARGDEEAALEYLYFILRDHPRSDSAPGARVLIARLEQERGNDEAARHSLASARLSKLTDDDRALAHRLLADLADDPFTRLRWLSYVREDAPDADAVALVDAEIDAIVRDLPPASLDRAADQIGKRIPAGRLRLREAELALDVARENDAARALSRARRLPIAPAYESQLTALEVRLRMRQLGAKAGEPLPTFSDAARTRLPPREEAQGVLGVVLPLSGRFSRFGEESLQGVLLAAQIFGAGSNGSEAAAAEGAGLRILVRDTAGRADMAAAAVRDLARQPEVAAIVGPIMAEEAEAAAAAAEDAQIPLLTLTAREEIAAERAHVFRLRTTPAQEVERLVEHAVETLGASRFAILYPRDSYGRGLSGLFWEAVERRGGTVVGVASYEPQATDFAKPIRRIAGFELLTKEERAALKQREKMLRRAKRLRGAEAAALRAEARALTGPEHQPLPPIVDFDVLFIPDSHEKAVLIAPQLAFHEVTGAHLLGPNGWNHPDLVRIARKHVEGAVFTTAFDPDSRFPFVEQFTQSYAAAFGGPPELFAAQAYDAANLVLVQLARGWRSREAVREGILRTQGYPGVAGVTSLRIDGNARKRPYLMAVERGHIVPLD